MQIYKENDPRWLHPDTPVWRYVPLRSLFFYLDGLVFVPSVDKLRSDEPFEGEFYEDIAWFNDAFHKRFADQAETVERWMFDHLCSNDERKHIEINRKYLNAAAEVFKRHYFDFIRRTRFAWCWFQSEHESAAMWSSYGSQGVAIRSTVGKIASVFEKAMRPLVYGKMRYVNRLGTGWHFNPERDADFELLLRPFFLKRKEYESEQEVRFVTAASERKDHKRMLLSGIDPKDWICAIRLWPRLTDDEAGAICNAVRKLLPEPNCQRSDLFYDPDKGLLFKMLDGDLEISADEKWTNGLDGIPQGLKGL